MRRFWVWMLRALGALAATLAVLSLLGVAWQRHAEQVDARNFPPPGKLLDVGGHRLHLNCTGTPRRGAPTIVLEALSGGSSVYWGWVQPALARHTRVCSYDRAGFGWSDPPPAPPALATNVADLHTLLWRGRVAPPYVLVGHSKGGIIVRGYQRAHPSEVIGLVLLEASHPEQFRRFPQLLQDNDRQLQTICLMPIAAELGLMRLYVAAGGSFDFGALRAPERAALQAFWSSPTHWRRICADMKSLATFNEGVESLGPIGDMPLAVITAGGNRTPGWQQLQGELTAISSRSTHIVVAGASHASLVFDEQQARRVSEAILDVASAAQEATSTH